MCRVAAFPPRFPRGRAIEILKSFERGNEDGTGYFYTRNGNFMSEKWPISLTDAIKRRKRKFLSHMPWKGWTLAHLRSGTHGKNSIGNSHPFFADGWGMIHNGIWDEYKIAKAIISRGTKFEGQTDSEIAAHFLSIVGPKRFFKLVDYSGVFMAMKRSGDLWIIRTSGDLVSTKTRYGLLFSSDLPIEYDIKYFGDGWIHFNSKGKVVEKLEEETRWTRGVMTGGGRRSSLWYDYQGKIR